VRCVSPALLHIRPPISSGPVRLPIREKLTDQACCHFEEGHWLGCIIEEEHWLGEHSEEGHLLGCIAMSGHWLNYHAC
jgi:hypothetical protein